MKHIIDISKYTVYRNHADKDLLIAVSIDYEDQIKRLIKEFGSFEKVPSSKTVRGIFVKNKKGNDLEMLTATEQASDITVNQLRDMN